MRTTITIEVERELHDGKRVRTSFRLDGTSWRSAYPAAQTEMACRQIDRMLNEVEAVDGT
jgi:hypothetical protein